MNRPHPPVDSIEPEERVWSEADPDQRSDLRSRLRRRLWTITGTYAVFAALWIYFSDAVLASIVSDPAQMVQWSVYKGLGFVAVTSLLLFFLIRDAFRAIEAGYDSIRAQARERRGLQEEAERLSRLYAALSHVNQAVGRSSKRRDFLLDVCAALAEHGPFETAAIHSYDVERDLLLPAARSGPQRGEGEAVRPDSDDPLEDTHPAVLALRSGTPQIRSEPAGGSRASDRADASLANGGDPRAMASLPIQVGEEVRAVLSVYTSDPEFLRPPEAKLLEEVAADVAFALEIMDQEEARRRAEAEVESERRFSEAFIASMPGLFYLYNREGRFLRWNRRFEAVSGYSAEEIGTMHPLELFTPEDGPEVERRIDEVFRTGESSVDALFLAKDGSTTPHHFTGRRLTFDGQECLVGVGVDISEQRAAERALKRLNQTLEQKIAERTEELQGALVRAEAADRLKSAFLATMSHELRTPLNSILGFTGMVLQGLPGPLNEEQEKQLGMVQKSARHLLALISDVLDLSKIEAGEFTIEAAPFDFRASLHQVAETVRPLAEAKGVRLQVEVDENVGTVRNDQRRVEQVLLNLLANGVKFTHTGVIDLSVEREDGMVEIRVVDTGIGIKPEDMGALFQPFRQIDTGLDRSHEGTGLGLAICRKLTGLMGGEISASSTWGEGSEFRVTLPVNYGSPS